MKEDFKVLPDNNRGKISKEQADEKAEAEYEEFNKRQRIDSDFDKEIRRISEKHKEEE